MRIFCSTDLDQLALTHFSLDEIKNFFPEILYSFDQFKQDLRQVISQLEPDENCDIYKQILQNYLNTVTIQIFISAVNGEDSTNHKILVSKPKHSQHIALDLLKQLKFLLNLLKVLSTGNLLHGVLRDFIVHKKYGLIKRINNFFVQNYKTIFFLNLIDILVNGINTLQITDREFASRQKGKLLIVFLRKYLNITRVFNLDFLQIDFWLKGGQFKNLEDFEKVNTSLQNKKLLLIECLNEIIFASTQESLSSVVDNNIDFTYEMYENKEKFHAIKYALLHVISQVIKTSYPEHEMMAISIFLSPLQEKVSSDSSYINSEFFFHDFCNGFFKHVGFSSLTLPLDFCEIAGKMLFNVPINSLIFAVENDVDRDKDLLSFLKDDSDVNVFKFLKNFNTNKFQIFIGKILEYRLESTYFKLFRLYQKCLPKNIDDLREIFYPHLA